MAKKSNKNSVAARIILKQAPVVRRDIDDWKNAQHAATRVDNPKFNKLQELYSYILTDAHLTSQINLRKARAIATPYVIKSPAGKEDPKYTDLIASIPVVRDIIGNILDAQLFGYSLLEFNIDADIVNVSLIDRRHIDPIHGVVFIQQSDDAGIGYRSIPEYGRSLIEFRVDGLGLLNKAIPHVLYKRFAQACWSEFCEVCGMPPRFIKTNTQDEELRERYQQMLANVGSGANYIIDLDDEIGFAQTNASDGSVYEKLFNVCKNEISLLITGAILGQDTVYGSNAKEQSSTELSSEIIDSDLNFIKSQMNAVVLPALAALGIIPAGLQFDYPKQEDISELFEQTIRSAAYFDINPEWFRSKFGIEVTGLRNAMPTLNVKPSDLDFFV